MGAEKCYLVDFKDCKDANEYLLKYGIDKLRLTIEDSKPCPLENIITLNDERESLREYYLNGAKKGFITGMSEFDNIFSTYTSQYIIVTGIPTHGKSEFVDSMVCGYNKLYGWKAGFCSLENKPTYLHLDKLCRKTFGRYPDKNSSMEEGSSENNEWIEIEE